MDRTIKLIVTVVVAAALLLFILLVIPKKTIKVGFLADLSTRKSQLGVVARNGVIMAVDELNASGGINDREVVLIIRDIKSNKDEAKRQTTNLIEAGVDVIIGPFVSAMAAPVLEVAKKTNTLVISPTAATDSLTGIDDNFIRITPQASKHGSSLATAVSAQGVNKVVLVRDIKNEEYTGAVADGFKKKSKEHSIEIVGDLSFETKQDFAQVVGQISQVQPDGIVLITSGIDAGAILQQYAKNNEVPHLFGTMWTKVTKVNEYGGKIVNDMVLIDVFANEKPTGKEVAFNNSFKAHFGMGSNMPSRYTYESVKLYAMAATKAKSLDTEKIKDEIIKMDPIEGITDNYCIDKYGDVIRKLSLYQIKDHQYQLINIAD